MEEWGLNPATFGAVGVLAAVVALILAYFQYRRDRAVGEVARMQNRKARNLDAFIAISTDMRQRWESGWADLLREQVPALDLEKRHEGDVGRQLTYMLNWLDWMGLIIKLDLIDPELVFGSLESVARELIHESAHLIALDTEEHGTEYWGNVLYVADQLKIDVDDEARLLRDKWSWTAPQRS